MVKFKYYVIFGFILFLITKFPDWKKNKNSKSYIDRSTVVKDALTHNNDEIMSNEDEQNH